MKKITKALIYLATGVGVTKLRTKDFRLLNLIEDLLDEDAVAAVEKEKKFVYTLDVLVWPLIVIDNLFEFIADDIFKLDIWNLED